MIDFLSLDGFVDCQRLCLTLLHSLWQMAALAGLAWLLGIVLGRKRVGLAYAVHTAAMVIGLLLIPLTFVLLPESTAKRSAMSPPELLADFVAETSSNAAVGEGLFANLPAKSLVVPGDLANTDIEATTSGVENAVPVSNSAWHALIPWLTGAYLLGVVVMLVRLVGSIVQAEQLGRGATPIVKGPVFDKLAELCKKWKIRVTPVLAATEQVLVPKVVGLLKPTILLPSSALTGLSVDQLELILAHELAHVRRHDLWVNVLQRVAEALLFFNPGLWWLCRRIDTLREYCCDDRACSIVSGDAEPELQYVQALLRAAELNMSSESKASEALASLAVASRKPSELRRRVARLFGAPVTESIRIGRGGMFLVGLLAAGLIAGPMFWPAYARSKDIAEPFSLKLLAIGDQESNPHVWWSPSGEMLENKDWDYESRKTSRLGRARIIRTFIVELHGVDDIDKVKWKLGPVRRFDIDRVLDAGGNPVANQFAIVATIDVGTETTTITGSYQGASINLSDLPVSATEVQDDQNVDVVEDRPANLSDGGLQIFSGCELKDSALIEQARNRNPLGLLQWRSPESSEAPRWLSLDDGNQPLLTQADVEFAKVILPNPKKGLKNHSVEIQFTEEAGKRLKLRTRKLLQSDHAEEIRLIAILDGKVLLAPVLNDSVERKLRLTGLATETEAGKFADAIDRLRQKLIQTVTIPAGFLPEGVKLISPDDVPAGSLEGPYNPFVMNDPRLGGPPEGKALPLRIVASYQDRDPEERIVVYGVWYEEITEAKKLEQEWRGNRVPTSEATMVRIDNIVLHVFRLGEGVRSSVLQTISNYFRGMAEKANAKTDLGRGADTREDGAAPRKPRFEMRRVFANPSVEEVDNLSPEQQFLWPANTDPQFNILGVPTRYRISDEPPIFDELDLADVAVVPFANDEKMFNVMLVLNSAAQGNFQNLAKQMEQECREDSSLRLAILIDGKPLKSPSALAPPFDADNLRWVGRFDKERAELTAQAIRRLIPTNGANDGGMKRSVPLKWGDEVKGLRASIELLTPDGVAGDVNSAPGVPAGTQVKAIFHVKNVSNEPVTFVSEQWRQGDYFYVTDADGKEAQVPDVWHTGWPTDVRHNIAPGETVQLNYLHSPTAHLKVPGKYALQATIRFNSRAGTDFPKAGDYQEELPTGSTTFFVKDLNVEVVDADNPSANNKASDASMTSGNETFQFDVLAAVELTSPESIRAARQRTPERVVQWKPKAQKTKWFLLSTDEHSLVNEADVESVDISDVNANQHGRCNVNIHLTESAGRRLKSRTAELLGDEARQHRLLLQLDGEVVIVTELTQPDSKIALKKVYFVNDALPLAMAIDPLRRRLIRMLTIPPGKLPPGMQLHDLQGEIARMKPPVIMLASPFNPSVAMEKSPFLLSAKFDEMPYQALATAIYANAETKKVVTVYAASFRRGEDLARKLSETNFEKLAKQPIITDNIIFGFDRTPDVDDATFEAVRSYFVKLADRNDSVGTQADASALNGPASISSDYQNILGRWQITSVRGSGGTLMSLNRNSKPGDVLTIPHVMVPNKNAGGRRGKPTRRWLSKDLQANWSRNDSLQLYPSASPSRLTYKPIRGDQSHFGNENDPPQFAIYKFDGDTLTILAGDPADYKLDQGNEVTTTSAGTPATWNWKLIIPNYARDFDHIDDERHLLVKLKRASDTQPSRQVSDKDLSERAVLKQTLTGIQPDEAPTDGEVSATPRHQSYLAKLQGEWNVRVRSNDGVEPMVAHVDNNQLRLCRPNGDDPMTFKLSVAKGKPHDLISLVPKISDLERQTIANAIEADVLDADPNLMRKVLVEDGFPGIIQPYNGGFQVCVTEQPGADPPMLFVVNQTQFVWELVRPSKPKTSDQPSSVNASSSSKGAPSLIIQVVDKSGVPISGATVVVFNGRRSNPTPFANFSGVTDDAGQWIINDLAKRIPEDAVYDVRVNVPDGYPERDDSVWNRRVGIYQGQRVGALDPLEEFSTDDQGNLTVTFTIRESCPLELSIVDAVTGEKINMSQVLYKDDRVEDWTRASLQDAGLAPQNFTTFVPEMATSKFMATAAGYIPKSFDLKTLSLDKTTTKRIELQPVPDIQLTVLTPSGKSAEGATLKYLGPDYRLSWRQNSPADKSGVIAMRYPELGPSARYRLTHTTGQIDFDMKWLAGVDLISRQPLQHTVQLSGDSGSNVEGPPIQAGPTAEKEGGNIAELPRDLKVRLADKDGQPISGVKIRVYDGRSVWATGDEPKFEMEFATTDAGGVATLPGFLDRVPERYIYWIEFFRKEGLDVRMPVRLVGSHKGLVPSDEGDPLVRSKRVGTGLEVSVTLRKECPTEIELIDAATGKWKHMAQLLFKDDRVKDWTQAAFVDYIGDPGGPTPDQLGFEFTTTLIPEMSGAQFMATHEGYYPQAFDLKALSLDQITRKRIELEPAPGIELTILTSDGKPAAGAKLEYIGLKQRGSVGRIKPADDAGKIRLRYPELGGLARYRITHPSGKVDIPATLFVGKSADKDGFIRAKIYLVGTTYSIRGRVIDHNAKPVAGAVVRAATGMGTLLGGGSTTTGKNGDYELFFGPGMRVRNEESGRWGVGVQAAHFMVSKQGMRLNAREDHVFYLMTDKTAAQFKAFLQQEGGRYWGKESTAEVVFADQQRELNFALIPDNTHPEPQELFDLLGKEISDPSVVTFVQKYGLRKGYKFDEGSYKPIDNAYALMFRKNRINWIVLQASPWGANDGDPGWRWYSKKLPANLASKDSVETVNAKLGQTIEGSKDRWRYQDKTLWVHFTQDRNSIESVWVSAVSAAAGDLRKASQAGDTFQQKGQLANGAKVKLVGLADFPSGESVWSPEGKNFPPSKYLRRKVESKHKSSGRPVELLFEFDGFQLPDKLAFRTTRGDRFFRLGGKRKLWPDAPAADSVVINVPPNAHAVTVEAWIDEQGELQLKYQPRHWSQLASDWAIEPVPAGHVRFSNISLHGYPVEANPHRAMPASLQAKPGKTEITKNEWFVLSETRIDETKSRFDVDVIKPDAQGGIGVMFEIAKLGAKRGFKFLRKTGDTEDGMLIEFSDTRPEPTAELPDNQVVEIEPLAAVLGDFEQANAGKVNEAKQEQHDQARPNQPAANPDRSGFSGAEVSVKPHKPEYFLGENVLLHWQVSNTGDQPLPISIGGDARTPGARRAIRFKVEARDDSGRPTRDPFPNPANMGGPGGDFDLEPGKAFADDLQLMRYREIDSLEQVGSSGEFQVSVYHDLGWETDSRQPDWERIQESDIPQSATAPIATTSIRFRMPNAQQARQVVEAMVVLPNQPNRRWGQHGETFADFELLRYPVYLPLMLELVEAGDMRGLQAIGAMSFPAATDQLIAFAESKDPAIAAEARKRLVGRTPAPKDWQWQERRIYLAKRSWGQGQRAKGLALGWRLLEAKDRQMQIDGANLVAALAEPNDLDRLIKVMDRALVAMADDQEEQSLYLRPPMVSDSLADAAKRILARGGTPPLTVSTPGQAIAWLTALSRQPEVKDRPVGLFRPANWQATARRQLNHAIPFVRYVALKSWPTELDDATAAIVRQRMSDPQEMVQGAACELAKRSKRPDFADAIEQVLKTTDNKWVLNDAYFAAESCGVDNDRRIEILSERLRAKDNRNDSWNMWIMGKLVNASLAQSGTSASAIDDWSPLLPNLRRAWREYVGQHRDELRAGEKLPVKDAPQELFPPGYSVNARNVQ